MRFRRGVYVSRRSLTAGCQLLLLRLSDDMNANGIVSVPRSQLARDLAAPESRISEWVSQAKVAGFLSVVKPARPGRTAVYQGLDGRAQVRPGVPTEGYGNSDLYGVRPGVPPRGTPSTPPTEGVQADPIETDSTATTSQRSSYEKRSA